MSVLLVVPRMFTKKWILTTALVVLGTAVCIRLGIWQLDRLAQRRAFNSQVLSMRAQSPLDISGGAPADIATMEWRAVTASGTFDFANQVAIRNQYVEDNFGYDLLTPLLLSDGTAVLVDRGWIPAEGADSASGWSRFDGPQQVEVQGLIRARASGPLPGGLADPTLAPGQTRLDYWTFVNLDRLALQMPYRILPVYIQLTEQSDLNLPIPHPQELDLSEGPHKGYALQWFAFACILFVGYPFFLRKQEERAA